MPPDDDVTIGELSRRLTDLNARIIDGFNHVNNRLDTLQFVSRETYTIQMGNVIDRVNALEEAKRWTIRTFVAAFIFPVLVAAIVGLMIAGR